jgi:hypothetical protein
MTYTIEVINQIKCSIINLVYIWCGRDLSKGCI